MNVDALISVRFLTTGEGGRKKPFTTAEYRCPMYVGNQGFDCRITIPKEGIEFGKPCLLAFRFLNRDLVLPLLQKGKEVRLWDGGIIATGIVIEVAPLK